MLEHDVWENYKASDVDMVRDALKLRGGISMNELVDITGVNKNTVDDILIGFTDQKFIWFNENDGLFRWKK